LNVCTVLNGRENRRKKNHRKTEDEAAGRDHDKSIHQTQLQGIEINSTRSNKMASSQQEPANSGRELKKKIKSPKHTVPHHLSNHPEMTLNGYFMFGFAMACLQPFKAHQIDLNEDRHTPRAVKIYPQQF